MKTQRIKIQIFLDVTLWQLLNRVLLSMTACLCLLLGVTDLVDGGTMLLRKMGNYELMLLNMMQYLRRIESLSIPLYLKSLTCVQSHVSDLIVISLNATQCDT